MECFIVKSLSTKITIKVKHKGKLQIIIPELSQNNKIL